MWYSVLLAFLAFVLYELHGFVEEYRQFNIHTDIQVKTAIDIKFPSVTLCTQDYGGRSGALYMACYKGIQIMLNVTCNDRLYLSLLRKILKRTNHAVTHPMFPEACIIINPFGNLTKRTFPSPIYRAVSFSGGVFSVYVHGHNDLGFSLDDEAAIRIDIRKKDVSLKLSNKLMISRLPSPYSSHCEENFESKRNIFPGPYSLKKCRNTCIFNLMLTKCGDVIQQWQMYKTQRKISNRTDDEIRDCLYKLQVKNFHGLYCHCPVSCNEVFIDTNVEVSASYLFSAISMKYLSNTYTEITEVAAYPASRFITDVGGWLSLFSGMSALSLLEIIIFTLLTLFIFVKDFQLAQFYF